MSRFVAKMEEEAVIFALFQTQKFSCLICCLLPYNWTYQNRKGINSKVMLYSKNETIAISLVSKRREFQRNRAVQIGFLVMAISGKWVYDEPGL